MNIRGFILRVVRKRCFQPLWEKVFHYSKVGMNYWGGATVGYSGEEYALRYAEAKLKQLRVGKITIFDVGANIGQFAKMAVHELSLENVIYSFEPSFKTYQALQKAIIEDNQIITNNIGFGSVEAFLTLYSSEMSSTIASLYDQENPLREFKDDYKEVVKIETIDKFCEINSISGIDYLKLDIEGHEYQALLGAFDMMSKDRISFIQFEFGECQIDSKTFFRDFYNLLHNQYDLYRIVSDGLAPIKVYSADLEVFSTANYLAELRR
jgi:FkbM family methyltransferase